MAWPLIAGAVIGGAMQAGGSIWGARSQAQQAREAAEAERANTQRLMQQYESGAQQGSQQMVRSYDDLIRQQQQNPMFQTHLGQTYQQMGGAAHDRAVQDAIRGMDTGQQGRVHTYDAQQAAVQQGRASLAQAVSSGRGMQAAQLGESDAATLAQQAQLRDQLGAAARGETPSIARQAMMGGMERAAQQQAGLAAQTRGGGNALLAQRQAQMMGGQAMQQGAREAAMMSLDERERAQAMFGQHMQGMRADSTTRDIQQASFQQQMEQANLQQRLADAGLATNVSLANAQALTGMSQFNVGQANQMALANAQAENQRRAMEAQARTGMSQFNVSRADQLAAAQAGMGIDALNRSMDRRLDIDRFNVGQRTMADAANTQWQQNLLSGRIQAGERGAFAGSEAARLGLGAGYAQPSTFAPNVGAAVMQGLGSGIQSGVQSWQQTQAQPQQNHMTNPYINNTIQGLQGVLNQ